MQRRLCSLQRASSALGADLEMAEVAAGAVPDTLEAAGALRSRLAGIEAKGQELLLPEAAPALAVAATPRTAACPTGWEAWILPVGRALAAMACTIALWGCIGIIAYYESMVVRPPPPVLSPCLLPVLVGTCRAL